MEVKKITINLPLYKARNAEHCQLNADILEAATSKMAEQYSFKPVWEPYNQRFLTENACYKAKSAYRSTEDVATSDKKRDNLFLYMSQLIDAAKLSPVEAKAEAGKRLGFWLDNYRGTARLGYAQETASISDFVSKMKEEENQTYIETLDLGETLDLLEAANKEFNDLYKSRSGELQTRTTSETMATIRPKVDEALEQLVYGINSLYMANELKEKDAAVREALGTLIDKINSYLTQLRVTLVRAGIIHESKSDKPDEGGDEPTPEPEPVTPEITAVYQKEGGDPENPHRIGRDEQTMVEYQGFTLKGQDGTLDHVVALINDQDYPEWIKPATITNVTENSFEFTMVPDLTEGQYKVRIETYDGGSPLVVEYPEPITLW